MQHKRLLPHTFILESCIFTNHILDCTREHCRQYASIIHWQVYQLVPVVNSPRRPFLGSRPWSTLYLAIAVATWLSLCIVQVHLPLNFPLCCRNHSSQGSTCHQPISLLQVLCDSRMELHHLGRQVDTLQCLISFGSRKTFCSRLEVHVSFPDLDL